MDVQPMCASGISMTPRGQFVVNHGWPEIPFQYAGEMQESLSAAAAAGIVHLGYELVFSDWSDGWRQMRFQRARGRGSADRQSAQTACERVGQAIQYAARHAMHAELHWNRELHLGLQLDLDKRTGSWRVRGIGKVVEIVEELDEISITMS